MCQVIFIARFEDAHAAVVYFDHALGIITQEGTVMGYRYHRAFISLQCCLEMCPTVDVKVVQRLVQEEQVAAAQNKKC